jgi:hypothetical protein
MVAGPPRSPFVERAAPFPHVDSSHERVLHARSMGSALCVRGLCLLLCPDSSCDVTRWLFSLLFALDEAALMAATQGGIRTGVGAIYKTTLDSSQAA